MKTFFPQHLLLPVRTLSASGFAVAVAFAVGGIAALPLNMGTVAAAPAGYTAPEPYVPKAPPRPSRSASATAAPAATDADSNDSGTVSAPAQARRQTRAYIFDKATFARASEAIHRVLTPKATFLLQEKSCKIIVQDDAVNIAVADALAVGLQPSVQGIPPSSGSYTKVTTPVSTNSADDSSSGANGTSGVFLPRSGNAASGTPVSTSSSGGQGQSQLGSRVEIQVDLQENGAPATSSRQVLPLKPGSGPMSPVSVPISPVISQAGTERPRRQVLVLDSGSTMRFQVNRSPQMEFFRRVAAETGYPTDKSGPAWKKVATQIAVKPVVQADGSIAVSVYPEIVVEVDGGVQQVMPLEDLGTSVTISEGQEVSLSLFPTGSEAFNDAFFGRKLTSSTMRTLSGSITIRARVMDDQPATSTAGSSPSPRVPLAPDSSQAQYQDQPLPDNADGGTYMYVGTELPYVDYSGYDYGYYNPLLYTNYSYCQSYGFCRAVVGSICRDVYPNCNNTYSRRNDDYHRSGNRSDYSRSSGGYDGNRYSGNDRQEKQVVLNRSNNYNNGGQTYDNGQTIVYRNPESTYYNSPRRPAQASTTYDYTKRVSSVAAATPTYQTRNTQVSAIAPNPPNTSYNTYVNPYRQPTPGNPYRQGGYQSVNPYRSNVQQGTQQRYYPNR